MTWFRVTASLVACAACLSCTDIEPFDEGPLRLPPPDPTASQAFSELNALAESILWDDEDYAHPRDDTDWRATRLAENADALEELERALRGPALRFPPPTVDGDPAWEVDPWRRLAALALLVADDALSRGDPDAAEAGVQLALELGRRVEGGQGGAIGYLVGHALSEQGFRWMREHASALPGLSLELDRARSTARLKDAFRGEYQYMSIAVDSIVESADPFGGIRVPLRHPSSYVFQPERTRRAIHDTYSGWLSEIDRPCRERAFDTPGELSFLDYVKPNSTGRIIMQIAIPSLARMGVADCNHEARHSGTRVVMELVRYESLHGRLPPSLDALVPDSMAALPEDPFAPGHSLRYSSEARLVYSVGANLEDDGGAEDLDEVIEVPAPGSP